MESRRNFFPVHKYLCTFSSELCHASTHKLFLSKDMLEKKFNPFSRPQAAISWLFQKISASIIDYPKILLLHSAANHFYLVFKNSLIFCWIGFRSQKCIMLYFSLTAWLSIAVVRYWWSPWWLGHYFFDYVPVTIFEWTFTISCQTARLWISKDRFNRRKDYSFRKFI